MLTLSHRSLIPSDLQFWVRPDPVLHARETVEKIYP